MSHFLSGAFGALWGEQQQQEQPQPTGREVQAPEEEANAGEDDGEPPPSVVSDLSHHQKLMTKIVKKRKEADNKLPVCALAFSLSSPVGCETGDQS